MIEPARRHGHSDPRYPASYFAQFSATSRAARAAHVHAIAAASLDGWEDERLLRRPTQPLVSPTEQMPQEQVQEENTVSDMIDRLRLAGDNAAALLRLDAEAARRVAMAAAQPG